jgi:hypothetical protein
MLHGEQHDEHRNTLLHPVDFRSVTELESPVKRLRKELDNAVKKAKRELMP